MASSSVCRYSEAGVGYIEEMKTCILNLPQDQIDEWFGEPFLKLVTTREAFDSIEVVWSLFCWSWEVLGTCCQTEFVHSRNHRRAHENQHWANFCGQSWNAEAALRHSWQKKV